MQNPELYSKLNKYIKRNALISQLLEEHKMLFSWGTEEVVLDAGCGPGDVTADILLPWLSPDCQEVVGVDISPAMVDHATSKHAGSKLIFAVADVEGDITHIAEDCLYPGQFDKVFSFYMLYWLKDMRKGLDNLYSLLKPSGEAFFLFPFDESIPKAFVKVNFYEKWNAFFKGVTRRISTFPSEDDPVNEFQNMLQLSGFDIIKVEARVHVFVVDGINVIKDLMESLDPHISRVPGHLKDEYLEDCLQVLEDMNIIKIMENKTVSISHELMIAIVKKQNGSLTK